VNKVVLKSAGISYLNGGNVGIGTTNPVAKLEVAGNTTITSAAGTTLKIEAKNDTAFNDPRIEFVTWNVASGASSGKIQLTNGTFNSNDMAFFTETGNSVTEKMRITSTGNVGIGTTSPTEKLVVDGKVIINNTTPPNNLAQLNIGSTSGGETRAIDIDGNWTAGESKSITFAYGTDATHMVGQINCVFNTSTDSRLRWGILYHGGVSSTYTMELKSTSTTTANLTVAGSIQMADDTDTASADKVGTLKYRVSGNNSYVDMCMQTGATTYAWINIVQNNW
jgi:hypothetical protein